MGFLCSLLLLASCHSDDNEPTLMDDEPQTVTISINLADAYTRTVNENEDSELRYLWMQVIDNGTKGRVEELTLSDNTATTSLKLYPSHSYTFLFWADDGTYDSATDLTNVAYDAQGTKAGLAYAARVDWNGEATINANLTHVTSKVTLKTTTKVWAGNQLTLTIPSSDLYRGYNVLEGVPAGQSPEDYTYDYTPETDITATEDNPVELFSFYVLAADETQDITISCNDQSITVPVNLSGGKHIILTGDVGGLTSELPTNADLQVTISDTWDKVNIDLDPTKLTDTTVASEKLQGDGTDTDPYRITSGADLLCYLTYGLGYTDSEKHARLETDIEITRTNWEPTYLDGTFDGGNHTISGTLTGNTSGPFGLFRTISGTVCNLIMDVDMTVTGNGADIRVGSIAGALQGGTIENCKNYGNIDASGTTGESTNCTGGIVGNAYGDSIEGCTNTGSVTGGKGGKAYVGGIAGCAQSTILENNVLAGNSPVTEVGRWE